MWTFSSIWIQTLFQKTCLLSYLETLNFSKIPPIFTYICTFGFGIRPKARCFSGFGLKSKTYFRSFTVGDLSPYTFDRYVNLIQSVSPLDLKMLRRARDLVKVKLRHWFSVLFIPTYLISRVGELYNWHLGMF